LVSLVDVELRASMLFYPASILIASQLLGVRAAFVWLVVTMVAYTVFYRLSPSGVFGSPGLDEMMLVYGVAVCVFFCCQQGEVFYRERTKGLVELSERLREKAQHLHHLATTDALTGLTSRLQFQDDLQECVQRAQETGERFALLVIDMDGFKEINDTLGHPVGDQALVEVANRLRREFSDEAKIARLGGDEFCLICNTINSREDAAAMARRASHILTQRYIIDEFDFPMGASVGIAICPDDTACQTELLAYADTAMFYAKERTLGSAMYSSDMTERLVEYRSMQEKLAVALEEGEFFLVYQPQVHLASGQVIGVEALLRWEHEGEIIGPDRFIPLLEKSREIVPVGRWIIAEACRQLHEWTQLGIDIEVSINLSAVQFADETLVPSVADWMHNFGLDPSKLDFEITESLLVDDVDKAIRRLAEFKQLGSSISIDDFGTGYSSLAYLQQFPLDRLKIDRAFVKNYPQADDGVIASSIVALSKALDLKVLAEGVETKAHVDFLKSLGCDEYQGFYYSKPKRGDDITQMLAVPSIFDA
ncbi:MAG: EAL domain-containing protein, partial [Planctomycetota bacterium]